jgi:adenylylsulfate kinase-like enzyme
MIINLFGQPESGKTTLARSIRRLFAHEKVLIIDGDELRRATQNENYTVVGRKKNLKLAYNLAVLFEKQGYIVVLALVSPYSETREKLTEKSKEIYHFYLHSKRKERSKYHVKSFDIGYTDKFICTDGSIADSLIEIFKIIKE